MVSVIGKGLKFWILFRTKMTLQRIECVMQEKKKKNNSTSGRFEWVGVTINWDGKDCPQASFKGRYFWYPKYYAILTVAQSANGSMVNWV